MTTSIVIQIPITKKGELHFFDVYIPQDVTLAFDVQADITGSNIPSTIGKQVANVDPAGMLRLQAPGKAGLCYGAMVSFSPSAVEDLLPGYGSVHGELLNLFVSPYYEREDDALSHIRSVGGHVLYGYYEDMIGRQVNGDISYTVTLTVWTKI